jgi:hypothetical protein
MSRYHTLYNAGAAKFATLQTGAASVNTAVNSRRITVITNGTSHFMAFGTSTVAATTASCVIPANAVIDFNFTTGTHVALLSASGAGYVTIIDSD